MGSSSEFYGQKIRQLRKRRHKTQGQFAHELNISIVALSNYELGKREVPIDLLIEMANKNQVSPNFFFNTRYGKYVEEIMNWEEILEKLESIEELKRV